MKQKFSSGSECWVFDISNMKLCFGKVVSVDKRIYTDRDGVEEIRDVNYLFETSDGVYMSRDQKCLFESKEEFIAYAVHRKDGA